MSTEPKFFVHEKGLCESNNVGDDTRIWAFAHVLPRAKVGKNCNICEGVFIENNAIVGNGCTIKNGVSVWDSVVLEDDVFVGPNAVFTNDFRPRAFLKRGSKHFLPTTVKQGATIGANATIVCGVTLGEYSFIGAGALVRSDVPAHGMVVGNPGRVIGRVCYCGQPLKDNFCPLCELELEVNSPAKVREKINE